MKKINVKNTEKVTSLISEVEKKAKQRLMQPYQSILIDIEKAEKKLNELNIPKKYWLGCSVYIQPEKLPNSYKYKAEGTYMRIEYFASGWFVVSCFRGTCKKESYGGYSPSELWLSDLAQKNIQQQIKL